MPKTISNANSAGAKQLTDGQLEMMHAALEVNLPNYASAIVDTKEALAAIGLSHAA